MKFNIINKKKIIAVILSGFVLINLNGCSNTDENLKNDSNSNYEKTNYSNKKENPQIIIEQSQEENNNQGENSNIEENSKPSESNIKPSLEFETDNDKFTEVDKKAIEFFNNLQDEVNNFLNSEDVNNTKDKAKGVFITIVDFIFYDSEIDGITFDQLTDNGKQKILEIAHNIDIKIENKFPNYKDTIATNTKKAFNKASELIKEGASNFKNFAKDKLGEENYNAISEAKDEFVEYTKEAIDFIGDIGSDLLDSGKNYIIEIDTNFLFYYFYFITIF